MKKKKPKKVVLHADCEYGPLRIETPVADVGTGKTVNQLAAREAVQALEQGRGWINELTMDGQPLQEKLKRH